MVRVNLWYGFLAFAAVLDATALPPHYEVHERRENVNTRWTRLRRIDSEMLLPMRIGLAQTDLEDGYGHLMKVSDPASPSFGQHWTSEQVIAAFRPSQDTESEVRDWLVESGIPAGRITHSDNKGWFAFYATAQEAENLLHAEYYEYQDSVTGTISPGCEAYHVPRRIQKHIDYITPGIKLLAPVKPAQSKRDTASANEPRRVRSHHLHRASEVLHTKPDDLSTYDVTITPACIAALYEIPPATSHHPNNSLGIFESLLEFYLQKDLDLFFTNFTKIKNGTHPIAANIDGGLGVTEDPFYAGGEVNLDLMVAYPIIHPQTITLYNVDDFVAQANSNDTTTYGFNTFLDALDGSYCTFSAYNETGNDPNLDPVYPDEDGGWQGQLICGVFQPTNVISVSYGGQESDVPISYQKRQCLEYLKLGLQGVSILFASGDAGVANYPGLDGPTGCLGPKLDIFNPTWPSTCPFVTTVGATKLYPGHTVSSGESAANDLAGFPYSSAYSSGGGFSNIYSIPEYQADAVATYFKKHAPEHPYYNALLSDTGDIKLLPDVGALAGSTGGIYNRLGRGYPDVSANGDNIAVYVGESYGLSGGTSASTPLFAGVVNRLNEERLNAGKGPIGFLNPTLYANPSMLNDIKNGSNPGCNTTGFAAVPGWDPVTGLGTPNFSKMLKYYLSLP